MSKDYFKYLSQEFDKNTLHLVKQKGFYLYEYMSDFENFKEELPSKERFYSSLTNTKINENEYEHVVNVCKRLEMKIMKYDHDLYLKYDVLLLADVLEKFKNNSLNNYGLCPNHYLSTSSLPWDAMLKKQNLNVILSQILTCIYIIYTIYIVLYMLYCISLVQFLVAFHEVNTIPRFGL